MAADIELEHLLTYVYGLTATAAFTERFSDELGEAAGPVRMPITGSLRCSTRWSPSGEELLWLDTWRERFADGDDLAASRTVGITPVSGAYPDKFEVSDLKALQSWLGNRMKAGKGKKSGRSMTVTPECWTLAPELLTLLAILEQTVDLTRRPPSARTSRVPRPEETWRPCRCPPTRSGSRPPGDADGTRCRASRPWGLAGGEPGGTGENWLLPGGDEAEAERLPDKCTVRMRTGDVLRMLTPGGGGWGRPRS